MATNFESYQRISPSTKPLRMFLIWSAFTLRSWYYIAQPTSWRTTPCWLSPTAYSIYSQLPSTSILEVFPPSETRGRAMPWWQGAGYHCRDLYT